MSRKATTASPAVPNKPAAPTVAQNTTTPKTQLDVDWTATYGAPKVSGYFVEYKKKSETNWTQWGNEYSSSNALETTITGLTEGTTYEARVQAKEQPGQQLLVGPRRGEPREDKNVDPEFSADTATRSIAENSAADTSHRRGGHGHRHRERHADLLAERHRRLLLQHRQRHRPAKGRLRHDAGLRIVHHLLFRDRGRQRPEGQQRHGGHGG